MRLPLPRLYFDSPKTAQFILPDSNTNYYQTKDGILKLQDKIKEIRQRLLLTQKELAKKLNCTDSYISLLERGLRPATEKFFQKFVNTLELPNYEKENLRSLLIEERLREKEKMSKPLYPSEYGFAVKKECKKGIDLVMVPIEIILEETLRYLKYGKDERFKADTIEDLIVFYRITFLRDFSEDNYEKDIQKAFENFCISADKDKSNK